MATCTNPPWDALSALYRKVSPGGFVIVDDYGCIPACAQAVDEFRRREAICDPLLRIDWTGVYWRKSHAATAARSLGMKQPAS